MDFSLPNSSAFEVRPDRGLSGRIRSALAMIQRGQHAALSLLDPVHGGAAGRPCCLLPGSFNPLHAGHKRMAWHVQTALGMPVWFELSIHNADKPDCDLQHWVDRLLPHVKFAGQGPVQDERRQPTSRQNGCASFHPFGLVLTRAATFVEKAGLFPGCRFAVGADTIRRVADIRFYQNSTDLLEQGIATITEQNCRFVVFGRALPGFGSSTLRQSTNSGPPRFEAVDDLPLPKSLRQICDPIAESDFRIDLSSTQLRGEN